MTTTTNAKPVREPAAAKQVASPPAGRESTRRIGREVGTLAVNAYERGIADIVAFEKDAAKITPYPWAKSMLTLSAELIEDVGAAYVKTARHALR
ncbi:hypothetical protein ACPCHT_21470 [Nucisporomicrobium flavum]|jgi:hypothetical protein|uniref:hypothetical protein n=1 Tax=Nucisporomicrobium flavum TaxID=2785915 RepID=UPI0018F5D64E|nr:hypothetical protein [Nucisporomicrobium flavum]